MTDSPTTRAVLIKAKGGLGNRMLSAVTGLIWADLACRQPIIDWRDGVYAPKGENAYPLLFDTPITTGPEELDQMADVMPAFWKDRLALQPDQLIAKFEHANHSNPRLYRKYSIELERLDQPEPLAVFWSYLPKMARLRRHLRGFDRFAGKSDNQIVSEYLMHYFRPNARVRAEVGTFLAGLPRPTIGVHLRFTDRKMPLEPFKAMVRTQLQYMPDASVFLATDSSHVESEFNRSFDRVYVTPKYLPEEGERLHSTQEGPFDKVREAENALIDMWSLAGCDHLIYSKNSTFSLASALIGNLSAEQQTDVDKRNLKVVLKRMVQPYM